MPGGFSPAADPRNHRFHQVWISIPRRLNAAFERCLQIRGGTYFLSLHTLTFGELHKVDIGIAEVHPRVLAARGHLSAVTIEAEAHSLVVVIVPDDRQDRDAISHLR